MSDDRNPQDEPLLKRWYLYWFAKYGFGLFMAFFFGAGFGGCEKVSKENGDSTIAGIVGGPKWPWVLFIAVGFATYRLRRGFRMPPLEFGEYKVPVGTQQYDSGFWGISHTIAAVLICFFSIGWGMGHDFLPIRWLF